MEPPRGRFNAAARGFQAVEKARCAIFSAETGFTRAYGAAGERETSLRKASEPTAHVAGFGLQSEGTQVMRKGSMTTERCHAVPAKGRNRTTQIENLGRATRGPVGPWAKPKANRRSQPKRAEGTASALCDD